MQCFDFEDILFVRNKWDCINADKKKRENIKIKLNKRIKEEWPWVKENHIFDTCLKQVRVHSWSNRPLIGSIGNYSNYLSISV